LFRQAINFAIDREQFVKTVLYGIVPATDLPFPPSSLAYFADLDHRYTYDLNKARALVSRAGLSETSFTAVTSAQVVPDGAALLQILQASLRQIGVTMTIENVEAARWTQLDHAGKFQMLMHSFGRASYDPATLFGAAIVWRPFANVTGYSSPEYTKLVTDAASTVATAQRRALYRRICELMLDECWCIPVAADPTPFAMAKSVEGLSTDRSGVPVLKNVWLRS
jgi:peptide/nickel transport system substrate-binding protein